MTPAWSSLRSQARILDHALLSFPTMWRRGKGVALAERKSESINDFNVGGVLCQRGKVGNGQWLLAGDY
jgi:hypothetical protein